MTGSAPRRPKFRFHRHRVVRINILNIDSYTIRRDVGPLLPFGLDDADRIELANNSVGTQ
jgi:hypothetical protein